jgi:hypothetical protein
MNWLRRDRKLAGPICFVVGLLLLARTHLYYGSLLRGWDAQYYYAAARSLVFDGDLDITNDIFQSAYLPPLDPDGDGSFRNVPRRPGGRVINVFPVGLSLIEAPGLMIGNALRRVAEHFGYRPTAEPGFSPLEINTVAVWLLILPSIGMHGLYALLAGRATFAWRVLALAGAWAGTSLLFYTAIFPFMAHAQAFALIVFIARLAQTLPDNGPANRTIFQIGALTILLYLVRPQQALFTALLVPPILPRVWRRPVREWLPGAALGVLAVVAGLWFQASVHADNLGHFSILGRDLDHPHPDISAHFRWADPHFAVVLVSASRGVFFITPAWLLGIAGAISAGQRPARWLDRVFLAHTLIQFVLIACWSNPWEGDAFGPRMLCESAPLVALGLTALYWPRPAIATPVAVLAIGCIGWTCALMLVYMRSGIPTNAAHADVVRSVLRLLLPGRYFN